VSLSSNKTLEGDIGMKIHKGLIEAILACLLVPGVCCGNSKDSVVDTINNTTEKIVETAADSGITVKVKALFALEQDIPSLKITVRTKDGVVHLSGVVHTTSQANRVVELAQGVNGVNDVDDTNLSVTP